MTELIHYEHPLNERSRTLLRLEHLFHAADHALQIRTVLGDRAALDSLFDVLELAGRNELRQELSKELEKQHAALEKMRGMAGLDTTALDETLADIQSVNNALNSSYTAPGQALREDEFLIAIRQRQSVPGGTCAFDLPELHQWLHRPEPFRQHELQGWYSEFSAIRRATECLLGLIRGSSNTRNLSAECGFFQLELDSSKPFQLIKVSFPNDMDCYPEISGGKHRITIRFMRAGHGGGRPMQIEQDLEFRLACSLL